MATLGPHAAGDADPAPAGGGDLVPDGGDGVKTDRDRTDRNDDSELPWAGIGVVVLVLVTGAFASGWHLGRRWGRLMGW